MTIWRWVMWGGAALVLGALGFVGWVYAASEAHLRSFTAPAPFAAPIPTDAAAIAYGERLTYNRGCRGCHGEQLEGELMGGVAAAPNLAAYARAQTPATIEAAVRHGIGHDGRALYSMPSYNFVHLSDDDLAAIIAYLRRAPVAQGPRLLPSSLPFAIRLEIARGNDGAIAKYLHLVPPLSQQTNPNRSIARGEYLAMTSCNECHGFGLRADSPFPSNAPDLIVVGAYSEAQFTRLMREGVPSSGAELEMMGPVARGRFTHWTDEEVTDLYAFLSDMSRRAAEAEN